MPFTSWATIGALTRYRTAKFKQRRQIQTRFQDLANVQIGGCTGLSYGWIQFHQKNPAGSASGRIISLNTDLSWHQVNYFAGVYNGSGRDVRTKVNKIALFSLLSQVSAQCVESDSENFTALLAHLDANPGYQVVVMALSAATDHLCAAHQGASHLTYFDPNSGEYSIANASRLAFFRALVSQYRTYISATGTRQVISINRWLVHALAPASGAAVP